MLTISDIAKLLGVTRPQAYGLVGLMQAKGVLKPTSKRGGSKGKPAALYLFTDEHVEAVSAMVRSLINAAPAQAETAQETAPQAEAASEPAAAAV